jgi:GH15 family glucan-1,4-alpha-glucosidase
MAKSRRPAGGYAPGVDWKEDGISWTPETSLYALSAASNNDPALANTLLRWLAEHRTKAGSIPEKVLHNGRPAAVAPLAWTAAVIVLTALELSTP